MKTIIFFPVYSIATNWLKVADQDTENLCFSQNLDRIQQKLCKIHSRFAPAIKHASKSAIHDCSEIMKNSRWGCQKMTSSDLKSTSAESSFIRALSTAKLTNSIFRLCQSGTIGECDKKFINGFVREFSDAPSIKHKSHTEAKMDVHNSKIGREVTWKSNERICKCHGTSGSCSVKTCWETAPQKDEINRKLGKKYSTAVKVDSRTISHVMVDDHLVFNTLKDRLVFFAPRRSFCATTRGRECEILGTGEKSCQSMCCGRGFIKKQNNILDEVCKFIWPSSIQCSPVIKTVKKFVCK